METKSRDIRNRELSASLRHARVALGLVESRIREVAPLWCCDHEQPPCLNCGLEWLIQNAQRSRPTAEPIVQRPEAQPKSLFRLIEFPAGL